MHAYIIIQNYLMELKLHKFEGEGPSDCRGESKFEGTGRVIRENKTP